VIARARDRMAIFLNASSPDCISFGANMTTLNYFLSKALVRIFKAGDEVVITELDHEANRAPWLAMQNNGIVIREVKLKRDGALDYEDFKSKITVKTKLVAMGMASNALGTVNDFRAVRKWTNEIGAYLLLDAVHYAPHFTIDVQDIDVDFLLCSAYKFYGPHVGILYSKYGLLDKLPTDCLRTQDQNAPYKIETGTLNHAALAGVTAAIDYIASVSSGADLRSQLVESMKLISDHEHQLADKLYSGLQDIKRIKIFGLPLIKDEHTPTIAFLMEGIKAADVCKYLAEQAICTWDGHYYAIRAIEVLRLSELGGLTRVGMSLYNTEDEVNRLLSALKDLSSSL
ncbi:MAG TPA: aminotransferase class V-fold PLP-dependent enzyme, partial [Caldithrix sp.]|nr:aminotransferase class V-fold PLP-dependent enzyme [Caldithrix sp.]